ncbi:MAG: exodeoxyribonuclease V subunit gamma [Oscillospiraceae bacterium]|nr:exodeoxyribonuclease V subunit gamma [Oscillospiraceae bacterium]
MLSIWIGRAGSGKSRRVLERMGERRETRPQVLIVPEHVSHEAELDVCRALGPTASRYAEVLSFRSLAGRVLAERGGLADFTLDGGGKLLTVRLVLQELHSQLKVFGRPSRRAVFLRELTQLIDELYAYEIAPETLYESVSDVPGASGDKLRDVALIYAAYDGKLRAGGVDRRSRVQKLRDLMEESSYLAGKDVYFDGFSYFNKTEESVVESLLRRGSDVVVTLLGERGNDELFLNAVRERQRLIDMARRAGTSCEIVWLTDAPGGPLGHLERGVFGADTPWEGEPAGIRVYRAGTAFTEVEYVAQQILKLTASGAYRCRDIGVMARNMDVYGPILENVFHRDGIPAYISRRSDILEKPVLTLLLGAVDAVTGGFEYEDMFRCLKTGMAGITAAECDLLENYVITWEIRGNMWLRDTPWTANPDGYGQEMTEERSARLAQINNIRERIRVPLSQLSEGLKGSGSAEGKAKALYDYAERAGVPETLRLKAEELLSAGQAQLAEEYGQLWAIFCGVLDQFVEILGDTALDGEEFARLLRLTLGEYSVGTIPATLDQVKISDTTRNDRHSVRCLFLLGANDNVLPTVGADGGLLDDEARELLQQRQIRLSDATFDKLDNELQNIYAALAQPTEQLTVSYPVTDLNGTELRPSFVVGRILKLFPDLRVTYEDLDFRAQAPATALELAGQDPDGPLWRYFAADGRYGAVLDAMSRARTMGRGCLSPDAVRVLYGRTVRMSASRMDRLRSCHFGYFMEYGLKARERKSAGFEAPEIGTFIHYLLENVTRDVMDRGGYGAVDRDELHRLVNEYVKQYTLTELPDFEAKSARFRYLFGRLRHMAVNIMEDIADELAESDFRPIEFELGFGGKDGALPAVTVQEGDTTMSVSGKVDRVDGWLKDGKLYLRVVDYKTGRKEFDLGDVEAGLGIQMLLYLFTLADRGAPYFGAPVVPAGVLYMPARDVILRRGRDISDEELERDLRKELRRSGLVLDEPEVLRAMEHSALESPCYLPISMKKDGTLTGSLASAARLGRLSRYVDKLLHQIAGELQQGNIDADPCWRGPQKNACTYCPFAAACGFDENRDRWHYLHKPKSDEFWQFIDRETGEEVRHG